MNGELEKQRGLLYQDAAAIGAAGPGAGRTWLGAHGGIRPRYASNCMAAISRVRNGK